MASEGRSRKPRRAVGCVYNDMQSNAAKYLYIRWRLLMVVLEENMSMETAKILGDKFCLGQSSCPSYVLELSTKPSKLICSISSKPKHHHPYSLHKYTSNPLTLVQGFATYAFTAFNRRKEPLLFSPPYKSSSHYTTPYNQVPQHLLSASIPQL